MMSKHIVSQSLLSKLDYGLFKLTCDLIILFHHSNNCSLVAEHLVLQTKLLLNGYVWLRLNLVKNRHLEESFSGKAFDMHEIGAIKS